MEFQQPVRTTALPLRVVHFHLGKLTRAEIDRDDDRLRDTRETHDGRARMIRSEALGR